MVVNHILRSVLFLIILFGVQYGRAQDGSPEQNQSSSFFQATTAAEIEKSPPPTESKKTEPAISRTEPFNCPDGYSEPVRRNDGIQTQIIPDGVICVGQACYYSPRRISASTLRNELPKNVFGKSMHIISPFEGFIDMGRTNTEIAFWHKCQSTLEDMKRFAVMLDQTILPTQRRKVTLNVKIYHITEGTYNNMSIGLNAIYDGEIVDPPPRGRATTINGMSAISMAFGNLTEHMLSVNLAFAKNNNTAHEIRDVNISEIEGEWLSSSLSRNNYRESNNFSNTISESSGYTLNGQVHIIDDDGETPYINLRNLSFQLSTPQKDNPNAIVEVLQANQSEIRLYPGVPRLVYSETFQASGVNQKNNAPIFLEKSKFEESSRLIIFVSGTFEGQNQTDKPATTFHKLTSKEVAALPPGNTSSFSTILQSAKFESKVVGESAFDLITFKLDPTLLDLSNYDQLVQVKLEGPGLKNRAKAASIDTYRVEHLALNDYQFPSVLGDDDESRIKITLLVHELSRKKKGAPKQVVYELRHFRKLNEIFVEKIKAQ